MGVLGSWHSMNSTPRPTRPAFGLGMLASVFIGLGAVGVAGFACGAVLLESAAAAEGRPIPVVPAELEESPDGRDSEHARDLLVANALYRTGPMEDAECTAPELDPADPESMEEFLNEVTDCMDQSWYEQVRAAPFEVRPPVRHFWAAPGHSPCGGFPAEDTAAFYCDINNGLYLGLEDIVANSQSNDDWESYAMLLSHEYGHHVQSEAGILAAYRTMYSQEADPEEGDGWNRRSELQANCLGGVFLGAVRDSYDIDDDSRDRLLADARARGDTEGVERRTHGNPDNGELWVHHGFDRVDPAACNTWDAHEDLVE
jgi:uncharacterized protein